MKKKSYKEEINTAISALQDQFAGLGKRQVINMIFDYIKEKGLIEDFQVTSLYNTIYYFLRKRNIFKVEEINYRFDSIDSKLKFLNSLRSDLDERWWFYHDLFFGEVERPVLPANTKVVSGNLNYLIESKRGRSFDLLYTLLYFRDLRKIVTSDMCTVFVKKPLNDQLYPIFQDLYDLDNLVKGMINSLDPIKMEDLKVIMKRYFNFLSDFNLNDYNDFHSKMVKNVNMFRKFIKETCPEILNYNQNRFFDAITFCDAVYSCALKYMELDYEFEQFKSIHYHAMSISYFVFFKFGKKMKKVGSSRFIDFFNSDLFFSYNRYIIEYYECFQKEVKSVLLSANKDAEKSLAEFDIVLRYWLYNKLRNLINSNLKRFIGVDCGVHEEMFMDVDEVNDCVLYESKLYCNPEPTAEIAESSLRAAYQEFFKENSCSNMDDVTNVAIDILNGASLENYDTDLVIAGKKLVTMMRDCER